MFADIWVLLGWFLVWMGVLTLVFLVCSLRTNVVLVIVFASLVGTFGALSAAYFLLAANFTRNSAMASTVVKVSSINDDILEPRLLTLNRSGE
jgi:succinate-acetate transporter protein